MNKQELQNEINKAKANLANLEKRFAKYEYKQERWKPKEGEWYGYINDYNAISSKLWEGNNIEELRYETYNVFHTRTETEIEAEKILIRRQLENIARRLNLGEEINWKDTFGNPWRAKYYISLNCLGGKLTCEKSHCVKQQGTIYCLDHDFLDVAIQEIGEERLKKYLRSE